MLHCDGKAICVANGEHNCARAPSSPSSTAQSQHGRCHCLSPPTLFIVHVSRLTFGTTGFHVDQSHVSKFVHVFIPRYRSNRKFLEHNNVATRVVRDVCVQRRRDHDFQTKPNMSSMADVQLFIVHFHVFSWPKHQCAKIAVSSNFRVFTSAHGPWVSTRSLRWLRIQIMKRELALARADKSSLRIHGPTPWFCIHVHILACGKNMIRIHNLNHW